MDDNIEAFAFIALIVLVVAGAVKVWVQERQLKDPDDKSVVYLDEVAQISALNEDGPFLVRTLRQSGNEHQADRIAATAGEAIKCAVSTFKRAKIDYVVVLENSASKLVFRRPFHDHRGRNEGKKVGIVGIVKIET